MAGSTVGTEEEGWHLEPSVWRVQLIIMGWSVVLLMVYSVVTSHSNTRHFPYPESFQAEKKAALITWSSEKK